MSGSSRRHHNNKGPRQIKRGRTEQQVARMAEMARRRGEKKHKADDQVRIRLDRLQPTMGKRGYRLLHEHEKEDER